MYLEREEQNFNWYKENALKVKVEFYEDKCKVWFAINNYNICLKLCIYEILDKVREDINLEVRIYKEINGQSVFDVKSQYVFDLIEYVENFVNIFEISENLISEEHYISDELWYAIS